MAKVVFLGDSAATGFGTVTYDLGSRLLQHHDVRFITQNDTGEPAPEAMATRTYSVQAIHPAQAIARGFRDGWKAEACIILGDFFLTRAVVAATEPIAEAFGSVPTFHYVPIEGVDLPPRWHLLWDIVRPVAMSEFGADQIQAIDPDAVRPPVLPHGIDTETFRPATPSEPIIVPEQDVQQYFPRYHSGDYKIMSKGGAKALFGLDPRRILALRTDRNMPRKLYQLLYRSMAAAMRQNEDIDMLTHCRIHDMGGNLWDVCSKYPDEIAARFKFTQGHDTFHGLPRSMLVALYNAADMYVSPSAEGFGLTIAEAMACGTPVVAMDYSSVAEVVGDAGKLVPVESLIDNEYDYSWARPVEADFTEAVLRLATHPLERRSLGQKARTRIQARYNWDDIALGFARLIDEALEPAKTEDHATVR